MTGTPRFCPVCGAKRGDAQAFCAGCGYRFDSSDLIAPVPAIEAREANSALGSTDGRTTGRGTSRSRRVAFVGAALVALAVAGVALVTWGPFVGSTTVPVVSCPTSSGSVSGPYPQAPVSFPPSISEPFVAASAASQLALYVSRLIAHTPNSLPVAGPARQAKVRTGVGA